MENYATIEGISTATYVDRKSEFIASASFADTEEKAIAFLEKIKAENRTARHNVYAYVLREGSRIRYSDDGEPQKTAGMPVLEAIQHAGLTNVIVVVTRYFGGILLGTGGLVRAYGGSAQEALEKAHRVIVQPVVDLTAVLPYALYEQALRLADSCGARVNDTAFTDSVTIRMTMREGTQGALLLKFSELCAGRENITVSDPYYAPF